jgi:hypothetical protein
MLKNLVLASGRTINVSSLLLQETGVHVNAVEAFPHVAGRFQMAASGIRTAAACVNPRLPVALVDAWARWFPVPDVHAHPIATFDRWNEFVPPAGLEHPPRWTCVAWLVSSPIEHEAIVSELVVGWFADAIRDLDAEIIAAASTIDWENEAQDWFF